MSSAGICQGFFGKKSAGIWLVGNTSDRKILDKYRNAAKLRVSEG
jgi:hypothetical protein